MNAWHQIYSSGPNASLRPHEVRTRVRGHGSAIINEGLLIQETEYNDSADPGVILLVGVYNMKFKQTDKCEQEQIIC